MDVLAQAVAMEKAGRWAEALAGYRTALDRTPNNPALAHRLGFVALQLGHLDEALGALRRSLAIKEDAEVLIDLGATLRALGKLAESVVAYADSVRLVPNSIDAHYGLALSAHALGDTAAAARHFRAVLKVRPDLAVVHDNLGVALQAEGLFVEALAAHREAVRLAPADVALWRNLAVAAQLAGSMGEAAAAYRAAIGGAGDFAAAWQGLARLRHDTGNWDGGRNAARRWAALAPNAAAAWGALADLAQAQERWDEAVRDGERAIILAPSDTGYRNNLGNALTGAGRLTAALATYRGALALRPDFPEAEINLAEALRQMRDFSATLAVIKGLVARHPLLAGAWRVAGLALMDDFRMDKAIRAFRVAIAITPGDILLHLELGAAASLSGLAPTAVNAFTRALALNPNHDAALAQCVHQRKHVCDWTGLEALETRLIDRVRAGAHIGSPFTLLAVGRATSADQLAAARRWAATKSSNDVLASPSSPLLARSRDRRVRVGYLSADFHDHPIANLFVEVLELHDRERFEITAYSTGYADGGTMYHRLRGAVERFVALEGRSDGDAARLIRDDGVDILVDLQGYTASARTGIMARRPAPIQVNWLGYPGTMGAPFIDYILADPEVIAEGDAAQFSEAVVRLPHCYQPNDRQRPIAPETPSRAACGLPEDGFVFCCFNSPYKLTPPTFALWMSLLSAVPGSVLWLFAREPQVAVNLRTVAAAAGIAPDRLVFASPEPLAQHLARHRLADLFLDTTPYNAHTTASDALWAGLPVVTQRGTTFAGRVAASLLQAVGLPELITDSPAAYKALALRLASDPALLSGIKSRLAAVRDTCPLFDTPGFTRYLETAYQTMVNRHTGGERPRPFRVAEIGAAPSPTPKAKPTAGSSAHRLHIVVPYRDREAHLREFIPGVSAFFAERAPEIDYRVTIVEQEAGQPFNRGALKNIGFLLGEADCDYVCLHDVDYLPIDADYSWSPQPTPILWYGAERRPVAPGTSQATVTTDLESTMGGVLLIPNGVFRQIDGYSNAYWGWGFEDFDFSLRIRARGIATDRRKGTFRPLDHWNDGFNPDATPAPIAKVNRQIFQRLWGTGKIPIGDGVSTLSFDILGRDAYDVGAVVPGRWEIVRTRINHQPLPEQVGAC